ncbi:hypothetical protein AAHE18_10G167800 [Arachis hypogaea]
MLFSLPSLSFTALLALASSEPLNKASIILATTSTHTAASSKNNNTQKKSSPSLRHLRYLHDPR